MILPSTKTTLQTLTAKEEYRDTLDQLLSENANYTEMFVEIQPLLYELSVKLYKENSKTIQLRKLVEDGIEFIKNDTLPGITDVEIKDGN